MKTNTRHRARACAVQAIYSWQVSHNEIINIENQFSSEQNVDMRYFRDLLVGVSTHSEYLDDIMKPYLSRRIEELDQVEKAILRISLYELSKRHDVPYKVAINEGIKLAKLFGSEKSYKFINGVLDKVALKVRPNKK